MAIRRNEARFWLDSDQAGGRAVEVTLRPAGACPVEGAVEVPTDEVGMRRFERAERLPPRLRLVRTYQLAGGCVTYRFELDGAVSGSATVALDAALSFQPRSELVRRVRSDAGLTLCGAGAPPCAGADS